MGLSQGHLGATYISANLTCPCNKNDELPHRKSERENVTCRSYEKMYAKKTKMN